MFWAAGVCWTCFKQFLSYIMKPGIPGLSQMMTLNLSCPNGASKSRIENTLVEPPTWKVPRGDALEKLFELFDRSSPVRADEAPVKPI